jgi:hypothetical protein
VINDIFVRIKNQSHMNKLQSKKPVNYYFTLIRRHLSRDEKKELMEKIDMSILWEYQRRIRLLKKQGKVPEKEFTPEEEAVYLRDTLDLDWDCSLR